MIYGANDYDTGDIIFQAAQEVVYLLQYQARDIICGGLCRTIRAIVKDFKRSGLTRKKTVKMRLLIHYGVTKQII